MESYENSRAFANVSFDATSSHGVKLVISDTGQQKLKKIKKKNIVFMFIN